MPTPRRALAPPDRDEDGSPTGPQVTGTDEQRPPSKPPETLQKEGGRQDGRQDGGRTRTVHPAASEAALGGLRTPVGGRLTTSCRSRLLRAARWPTLPPRKLRLEAQIVGTGRPGWGWGNGPGTVPRSH